MLGKALKRTMESNFPALRHQNYRLFFFGQCISMVGTWMQNVGQAWLVLDLTHSAFKLSLVTVIQFLPMMFLALYAGTLADRFSKRKLLIFTQTSFAVLAVALATLTFFHLVQYWHVLVMALLLGIINTLDAPTRQSFFIELVGREDLMNAIALNSSIFNVARIIGPGVAGLMIGLVGIGVCFYINAISYVAVIASLCVMNTPAQDAVKRSFASFKEIALDIKAGLFYIKERIIIRQPLILLALISTFVMNYNILIPVYAKESLGQNATGYGLLMTSMGIGSLIGALILATKSKIGPKIEHIIAGAFGMSVFLCVLGLGRNYLFACIALAIFGFSTVVFTALINSIIQLNSDDNMRGRVMSVHTLLFCGVVPIGSLYAGNITEHTSAPVCLIISGIIGIVVTMHTAFVMRKHYIDKESERN